MSRQCFSGQRRQPRQRQPRRGCPGAQGRRLRSSPSRHIATPPAGRGCHDCRRRQCECNHSGRNGSPSPFTLSPHHAFSSLILPSVRSVVEHQLPEKPHTGKDLHIFHLSFACNSTTEEISALHLNAAERVGESERGLRQLGKRAGNLICLALRRQRRRTRTREGSD